MVPSKFELFKDPFTVESAVSMFNFYLAKNYDISRCFKFTLSNLKNGILIDGRGRKISVEYNLSKYSDAELAVLKSKRTDITKPSVKQLPKQLWIQRGLFDDTE